MPVEKTENKIMKTTFLLVGAMVTSFALSSFAAEPLLSPRAHENQIKISAGAVDTQGGGVAYASPTASVALSPRAENNLIRVVAASGNEVNPALVCQKNMTGSPKAVAQCIASGNMAGCMGMASAK